MSQIIAIWLLYVVIVLFRRIEAGLIYQYLQPDLLLAHGIRPQDIPTLYSQDQTTDESTSRPYFVCGPLSQYHAMHEVIEHHSNHATSTSYVSKYHEKGCFLAYMSITEASAIKNREDANDWSLDMLPNTLKIHSSVLSHLQKLETYKITTTQQGNSAPKSGKGHQSRHITGGMDTVDTDGYKDYGGDDEKLLEHEIMIEFVHAAVSINPNVAVERIFHSILLSIVQPHAAPANVETALQSKPWNTLVRKYLVRGGRVIYPAQCAQLPKSVQISYRSHSLVLSTISGVELPCLASLVHAASLRPEVLRIAVQPLAQLVNYEARGIIQGGGMDDEPYREAGLEGNGQVCGVADSGVNDLSCFFVDNSGAYGTLTTNRTGVVEPLRRKIIQYVSYADELDEEGGHGSHVCGTVAGSSGQEFGQMSGMAPKAKIAFFDIGVTHRDFLKLPAIDDIFTSAYRAGARVHTNSWGNLGGLYGQMSFDVDRYAYDHPDFLIIFAAGNSGDLGGKSIISPGNAKNSLSVGAAQVRTVLSDQLRTYGDGNTALAYFSSLGPTHDGRLKPDIIAPGDFIQSAYAGDPDLLEAAINGGSDWNGHESCAVHQMSGTSMAAPAAAGTALLIREFFMDPVFWASACNKAYTFCKNGAFVPSGYFLKAVFLHSGHGIKRYSDPIYDAAEGTKLNSFELFDPPDNLQGYGQIYLKNVLPLHNKKGLHPDLQLIVFDSLELHEHSTMAFDIVVDSKDVRQLRPIKITLTWYDPPSFVGSSASLLLHDLDLAVHGPNDDLFLGNMGPRTFRLPSMVYTDPPSDWKSNDTESRDWVTMDQAYLDEVTDSANTNEQVFIAYPQCSAVHRPSERAAGDVNRGEGKKGHTSCLYRVYVHANTLTESLSQKFAVIFTIPRTASLYGPVETSNWVRIPDKPYTTFAPTPAFTVQNLAFNAKLAGTFYDKYPFYVPFCTTLQKVDIWLTFDHLDTGDTWPSNLELTILSPSGNAVAIGGADSSLGLATKTTEWPDSWINNESGAYYASINVAVAGLDGPGAWEVYVMNSWSGSGAVWFNASLTMDFASAISNTSVTCSPTPQPTLDSTVQPTLAPSQHPVANKLTYLHTHSIHFTDVSLAVRESQENAANDNKMHIHSDVMVHNDAVTLEAFNFTGTLEHIGISIDGIVNSMETRGLNSWFFTVTISDSRGLEVQVGGYEWLAERDRFYVRRWPDPWIGKASLGRRWVAQRDVHAAGLIGCRGSAPDNSEYSESSSCPAYIRSSIHKGGVDEWYIDSDAEEGGQWLPIGLLESGTGKTKHSHGGLQPSEEPTPVPSDSARSLPIPHKIRHRNSDWVVKIAMGYPWGLHSPVNFSGIVQLTFRTAFKELETEQNLFREDSWDGSDTPPPDMSTLPSNPPSQKPKREFTSKNSSASAKGRDAQHNKANTVAEIQAREALIQSILMSLVVAWIFIALVLVIVFTSWCGALKRLSLAYARFFSRHVLLGWMGIDAQRWLGNDSDAAHLLEASSHGLLVGRDGARVPGVNKSVLSEDAGVVYPSVSYSERDRRSRDSYGSINI